MRVYIRTYKNTAVDTGSKGIVTDSALDWSLHMQTDSMTATHPILPPEQQNGRAEKNVARLLYNLGLVDYLFQYEDLAVRLENGPYIPLNIEQHGEYLYLYHCIKINSDPVIDSELVMLVSPEGALSLYETAVWGGYREHRGMDRPFSALFSKNLLEQGFSKPNKPSKDPMEMSEGEFEFNWNQIWEESDMPKRLGRYGLVKEALIEGKRIPEHFSEMFAGLVKESEAPVPEGLRMLFTHPLRRKAQPGSRDEGKMVSAYDVIPAGTVERFTVEAPDRETAISRAIEHLKDKLIERIGFSLNELKERGLDQELLSIISKGSLETASINHRFFDSGCRVSMQQERLSSLGLIYPHTFNLTPDGVKVVQVIQGIETPEPDPDTATSYKPGMKVTFAGDLGEFVTIEVDQVMPYPFSRTNQRIHGKDESGKGYWTVGDLVTYKSPRSREQIFNAFVEDLCSLELSKSVVSANEDSEMARQLLKSPLRDLLTDLAVSRPSTAAAEEFHTIAPTIEARETFISEVVKEAESRLRLRKQSPEVVEV